MLFQNKKFLYKSLQIDNLEQYYLESLKATQQTELTILCNLFDKKGFEGIIVKQENCMYEFARRNNAWIKLKLGFNTPHLTPPNSI